MSWFLLADMIGDTARQFGVTWPQLIAQIISFLLVALLLHRFAYKPILRTLDERRQRVAESLANAEKIKQELARVEAARQEILQQANAQAEQLIQEARAAAARLQEQETQRAVAAAQQILDRAREAAAAERTRMLAELRREIGRLVVQTTAKVTGKILTPADHQRLVEETQRELAA